MPAKASLSLEQHVIANPSEILSHRQQVASRGTPRQAWQLQRGKTTSAYGCKAADYGCKRIFLTLDTFK